MSKEPKEELKPCRCCGESEYLEYSHETEGIKVVCGCGASGSFGSTFKEADSAWNQRADTPNDKTLREAEAFAKDYGVICTATDCYNHRVKSRKLIAALIVENKALMAERDELKDYAEYVRQSIGRNQYPVEFIKWNVCSRKGGK